MNLAVVVEEKSFVNGKPLEGRSLAYSQLFFFLSIDVLLQFLGIPENQFVLLDLS